MLNSRFSLAVGTRIPGLAALLLFLTPTFLSPQSAGEGSRAAQDQARAGCPAPAALIEGLAAPLAHVRYLADDALMGREVGSPGAWCAAEYIAAHFRDLGLEPVGPDGSYFQSFPIRAGSSLGSENLLRRGLTTYPLGQAWIPFGFSGSLTAEAPLIYGGHGISRPGTEDDVYAHLNLEGKIVVVESGDPGSSSGRSLQADPHFKATVAAGRRAAGIIVLLPGGRSLPSLENETRSALRIPAVAAGGEAVATLRAAAEEGEQVTLTAGVEPRMVDARNVVALLPGTDPELRDEVVVIGAHFDHLGLGGDNSLSPDDLGTVHNGADDNASGTAAIMEIASRLVRSPHRPNRSVLFIAFTGEEKGLWGSAFYVEHPLRPLDRTVAMLNLDMVGRMVENRLTVFGTGTAEEWGDLLAQANSELARPIEMGFNPDGFGASDQTSFYGKQIPVLHFNTSTHADYHRPSDDWELINEPDLVRVTDLVEGMTRSLTGGGSNVAAEVTFVEAPENPHAGGMPTSEDQPGRPRGYGAYLGTIPDMSPIDFGVRLTGVRENSPAANAGLQAGDIIVELEGKEVGDLYAYTYALREHKPGDVVTIIVLRDGERVRLTATLGER